ncbi:MAG: D-2-hydroxyacid dehydrogenase [Acetobacteraceae bacterium]
MRIHVQNSSHGLGQVTPELWARVATRLGEDSHGHVVSFGARPADFHAAIGEAEALVTDKDVLAPLLPFNAPHLKLIFVANAGLDNLAPFDWLPPGAELLNNRGAHAKKAGEFGIMAVLMLASRVPQMVTHQRAGRWRKLWGGIVEGRRLTIVGLGALGGAVAAQASHFGLHVTGVRAHPAPHPDCAKVIGQDGLDAALAATEFLVLACPLTPATHKLLDRRRIGLLPKDAGVVNIGRGPLLDQEALCDALDAGLLSGAVLDVFDPEPIPEGDRIWSTPNLVISPHTAADNPGTYYELSLERFFADLRAYREGRPLPTRFDIAAGY